MTVITPDTHKDIINTTTPVYDAYTKSKTPTLTKEQL